MTAQEHHRAGQTRAYLPRRALAQVGAHAVDAGGAVETSRGCAVVDVLRAHLSCPAIHTDAGEAAHSVGTGGAVL